jgi:hypothetical protein
LLLADECRPCRHLIDERLGDERFGKRISRWRATGQFIPAPESCRGILGSGPERDGLDALLRLLIAEDGGKLFVGIRRRELVVRLRIVQHGLKWSFINLVENFLCRTCGLRNEVEVWRWRRRWLIRRVR